MNSFMVCEVFEIIHIHQFILQTFFFYFRIKSSFKRGKSVLIEVCCLLLRNPKKDALYSIAMLNNKSVKLIWFLTDTSDNPPAFHILISKIRATTGLRFGWRKTNWEQDTVSDSQNLFILDVTSVLRFWGCFMWW